MLTVACGSQVLVFAADNSSDMDENDVSQDEVHGQSHPNAKAASKDDLIHTVHAQNVSTIRNEWSPEQANQENQCLN